VLEGKIPPRALKMVEEWSSQHQQEFMRGWKLAQGNEPPEKNSFSEYLLKGGVLAVLRILILALYGFQTSRIFCENSPSQQAKEASYNLLLLRKDCLFCRQSECYGPPSPSISLESVKSLDFSKTFR